MSAVIFNALIIIALIPLALRGVPYRAVGAAQLLRDNLLIYGLGGLFVPFIGIKLIDMALACVWLDRRKYDHQNLHFKRQCEMQDMKMQTLPFCAMNFKMKYANGEVTFRQRLVQWFGRLSTLALGAATLRLMLAHLGGFSPVDLCCLHSVDHCFRDGSVQSMKAQLRPPLPLLAFSLYYRRDLSVTVTGHCPSPLPASSEWQSHRH
jgi:hypothetical protein